MPKQEKKIISQEVMGIIFLLVATLLAGSLFSYDPRDMGFNVAKESRIYNNWVGSFGAYLVFFLYWTIGWAANLFPLAATYLAVSSFFRPDYKLSRNAFCMLGFVLCMSTLVQILGWGETSWTHKFNIPHLGGMWGYLTGEMLFWRYLKHGATIMFLGGSVATLYFALQPDPREVYAWIHDLVQEYRQRKREAGLRSGDLRTVLRTREEEIIERQRTIARQLNRQSRNLKPEYAETESPAQSSPDSQSESTVTAPLKEKVTPRKSSTPEISSPIATNSLSGVKAEIASPSKVSDYKITRPEKPKPPRKPVTQPKLSGPYQLPPLDLLKPAADASSILVESKDEIVRRAALIETTLRDFGIEVQMGEITQGSTITRFEVIPSPGVRIERIVNLENNLTLALKAEKVNILAPVPGKGTVGIEVANITKAPVLIRELIESPEFQASKAKMPLALGKDVYGKTLIADLTDMPHLLIAGSTGAGKSVGINGILTSLLYKLTPEQLRLILIDPKVVELQVYNTLPHLVVPVVSDPKKVIVALRWVIREMEKRYKIMAKAGVRNIHTFNGRVKSNSKTTVEDPAGNLQKALEEEASVEDAQPELIPEEDIFIPDFLPFIVVVIDELADLMLTAPVDAEDAITRITQMARAAGIHLIVATQTPRAEVVTGTIKTNLPTKIAFRVASKIDSRVILDENGAENLLGKGDMIYKSSDSSTLRRAQGAYISDEEVRTIVECCAKQAPVCFEEEIHTKLSKTFSGPQDASDEDEEAVEQCIQVIRQEGRASVSLLQRRLRLGYTRAARIMDLLVERGVVGPANGSKDREILIRLDGAPPD